MAEIKSMLDDAIVKELDRLKSLDESDTDGRTQVIQDLTELHKLRMEELSAEANADDKRKQAKDSKIDRVVKIGVVVLETGVPLIFYGIWLRAGLRFERDGTISSATVRNLIGRFKPTKK